MGTPELLFKPAAPCDYRPPPRLKVRMEEVERLYLDYLSAQHRQAPGVLCAVLNWTADEVEAWTDLLVYEGDERREDVERAIGLLRRIGERAATHWAESGGAWALLALDEWEATRLCALANCQPVQYRLEPLGAAPPTTDGPRPRRSIGSSGLLAVAAQGLWPILAGEVELLRCPAPAPNEESLCGRYLTTRGRRGFPARYCSGTCRKRAQRWRLRQQT